MNRWWREFLDVRGIVLSFTPRTIEGAIAVYSWVTQSRSLLAKVRIW